MKFFFPDSQDFVDPHFDFATEKKSSLRVRQRDDVYAHQLFAKKPYDGLLISKAVVEGVPGHSNKTRYSEGQRYRFFREGAHRFFRLDKRFTIMGDSGAFTYVNEERPPYTNNELIEFYEKAGVNIGVSLDHIVFGYQDKRNKSRTPLQSDREFRLEITLDNAEYLIKRKDEYNFIPYGVAHGWDKKSYLSSILSLQKMGYQYITIGGVISLKTEQICGLLEDALRVSNSNVQFHLLGVGRTDIAQRFVGSRLISMDSTTPLKKSFMNSSKNYQINGSNYCAIRIPQSYGNLKLRKGVSSGEISQKDLKLKESLALNAIRNYAEGNSNVDETLEHLFNYEDLVSNKRGTLFDKYKKTLLDKPWETCSCEICKDIGVEVIIYRGSERNKRRGFHNLLDFYSEFKRIETNE
ncbi:tRNA-guanine transglycosylase DpdA [Vibrio breoganii]|uniref:tRNA-guanine transglycosylase DpdA n=1 Tax=Vibrio breoganii TaxID=553239 RepID=UPI0021C33E4D|nr:tRNA-guanine transglycosylase DpdA [Vibrio breoganii]MDN3716556.1 tRNA-guanine transglycosylase DpdA [Vibrio breoganii]